MTAGLPTQRLNLGLDLKGGAHLLFQVETGKVVAERMESLVAEVRAALRQGRLGYTGLKAEGDAIVLRLRDPARRDDALALLTKVDRTLEVNIADDGVAVLTLSETAQRQEADQAVAQSVEVIRRRIDEDGTREPLIQRQGSDRILVQMPGVEDTAAIKQAVGRTAKMSFHIVVGLAPPTPDPNWRPPPGTMTAPSRQTLPDGRPQWLYVLDKRLMVGGDRLTNAQPTLDQNNQPAVNFQFDSLGARSFGRATTDNVGRQLAIVLDGTVISAPEIRQPITGGSGIITGHFTSAETTELALLLRSGALPAPLTVLEEHTVGPGLGRDSITAGMTASLIGLALVVIFMLATYGRFGLIANLALALNLCLIVAAMSLLQATLTLPGIAGIVLTIGMAVDANVLIFERIREEVRSGRPPLNAIESGYQRAITSIIDSNVTTLIAAALLFAFGSGSVKGFAVTLSIGLVTSMFSAILVTRLIIATWARRRPFKTIPL